MCTAVALSLAIITPFQSGEMVKVELLKKHANLSRFTGYSSFLVERVVDLLTVVTMGVVGVVLNLNMSKWRPYLYAAAILAALIIVGGLAALKAMPLRGKPREFVDQMRQCIGDGRTLALVLFWTVLGWLAVAASWLACLRATSVNITLTQCVALMALITLASILSLIPGAVGIAEAGTAEILIGFGYSAASGQGGAVILRGYGLLLILLGVIHLMLWRFITKETRTVIKGVPA